MENYTRPNLKVTLYLLTDTWWESIRPTPLGILMLDKDNNMKVLIEELLDEDYEDIEMLGKDPTPHIPLTLRTQVAWIDLLIEAIPLVPSGIIF